MQATRALVFPLLLQLAPFVAAQQCPGWSEDFGLSGLLGDVHALASFDDGGGAKLYAGGTFTIAESTFARRIARWDGANWSALPQDIDHNAVECLAVFDDGSGPALYVGGSFVYVGDANQGQLAAPGIARWNGTAWSAVGNGLDGTVLELVAHDDGSGTKLYAGGTFTSSGATPLAHLARWDGSAWQDVGGGTNDVVRALGVHDEGSGPRLFAGGEFSVAGGVPAGRVARWNGTAWSALAGGIPAAVDVLSSWTPAPSATPVLLAGGQFSTLGAQTAGGVARWNGTAWSTLATGTDGFVTAFAVFDDGAGPELHAGGPAGLHRWNGTGWTELSAPWVRTLLVHDEGTGSGPALFSGLRLPGVPDGPLGIVRRRGGVETAVANSLAPNGLGRLLDGTVAGESALFASSVRSAGGTYLFPPSHSAGLARFDGSTWTPLATNVSPLCLARFDVLPGGSEELCFGGSFAFGTRMIAVWDGATMSYVGAGGGEIRALTVFDGGGGPELYATGLFTSIEGVPASQIARFAGGAWSAVGTGLDWSSGFGENGVDLAVFDDGSGPALYVAGSFDQAGGVSCPSSVARWNGTSWSAVGAGATVGGVRGLHVHAGALHAFGDFTQIGGVSAQHVARWNGTAWEPLGAGLPGYAALDLATFDDGSGGGAELHAGIWWSPVPLGPSLLRFDGSNWVPTSAALEGGAVQDLVVFDGNQDGLEELYATGGLTSAGTHAARILARLDPCGPVSSFCAGDGVDAHVTTACPCGNVGGVGRGCAWHAGPMGALLAASGTTNPDALVLTASGMPASAPSTIFLKGDVLIPGGVVFGDGVRCVGGNLIRLGTKTNVGGAAQYPEAGNVAISVRGQTPVGSGAIGYYQTYYRNAAVFCTSSTFNVTNAVRVVW